MTTTPHTGNAEALRLADMLEDEFKAIAYHLPAAAMLHSQAQEIATLRDERDAFCTEADVLCMQVTVQSLEIADLQSLVDQHEANILWQADRICKLMSEVESLKDMNDALR